MLEYYRLLNGEKEPMQITKDEALEMLDGNWEPTMLDKIFEEEIPFRLYTPFSEIWTKDEEGRIPVPDFFGVVGDCVF